MNYLEITLFTVFRLIKLRAMREFLLALLFVPGTNLANNTLLFRPLMSGRSEMHDPPDFKHRPMSNYYITFGQLLSLAKSKNAKQTPFC
jgi:hypothetical protein